MPIQNESLLDMSFSFPSRQIYGVSVSTEAPFAIRVHRRRYSDELVRTFRQLNGTWELESYTAPAEHDQDNIIHPLGPDARGWLIYCHDGYVSMALHEPGQAGIDLNSRDMQAKLAEATRRYLGYAGPFLLEEIDEVSGSRHVRVSHVMTIVNFPNWRDTTQAWKVTFRDDKLILSLESLTTIEGIQRRPCLIWTRMEPNGAATPSAQ